MRLCHVGRGPVEGGGLDPACADRAEGARLNPGGAGVSPIRRPVPSANHRCWCRQFFDHPRPRRLLRGRCCGSIGRVCSSCRSCSLAGSLAARAAAQGKPERTVRRSARRRRVHVPRGLVLPLIQTRVVKRTVLGQASFLLLGFDPVRGRRHGERHHHRTAGVIPKSRVLGRATSNGRIGVID
jgi:hypothetical protein